MASKDNIGTCRLCLRTGVELIDGHIVPSWAYYRCSLHGVPGRNPKMNPNPWILSSDAVVQTSRQVREYMLCGNCEQRFGIDETYASTLAYQADGTASLFFDQIIRDEGEGIDLPVPARAPGIDLARLARFGSSVLWRAHVSIQIPECKLGKYGDNFRLYLSGEGEFPPDAAIVLRFFEDSPRTCRSRIGRVCVFPSSRSAGGYHLHTLVICGMRFEIAVGRCIDRDYQDFCLIRGNERCLIIDSPSDLRQHTARLRGSAVKAHGLRRLRTRR